jgi:hypothetical protein
MNAATGLRVNASFGTARRNVQRHVIRYQANNNTPHRHAQTMYCLPALLIDLYIYRHSLLVALPIDRPTCICTLHTHTVITSNGSDFIPSDLYLYLKSVRRVAKSSSAIVPTRLNCLSTVGYGAAPLWRSPRTTGAYWAPRTSMMGTEPGIAFMAKRLAMAIMAARPFLISTSWYRAYLSAEYFFFKPR